MRRSDREILAALAPYVSMSIGIVDCFERLVVVSMPGRRTFQDAITNALNSIALDFEAEEGAKKNREKAKRAKRKPWPT